MSQPLDEALMLRGRVSVAYCQTVGRPIAFTHFTDSFTDSGRSESWIFLSFRVKKLEPTVRIELTTRALRKRCSTD